MSTRVQTTANYSALAAVVESMRARTKIFTASFSTTLPIDSDSVGTLALNLDLISAKYGVVFVVPTGNLPNVLSDQTLSSVQPNFRDPGTWFSDPAAQMSRPGEAFNAFTVASYAETQFGDEHSYAGEVTIYSRRGPGPKAMPKPDLAEAGGNCVLFADPNNPTDIQLGVDEHPRASLSNLKSPSGVQKSFGTSFAVPKVAFALAHLTKLFEGFGQGRHAPILAKAYLAHIAKVPDGGGPFPSSWTEGEKLERLHLLYGHGVPDQEALQGVLPTEVCFFSATEIQRRQRHIYKIDLPVNLLDSLPDIRLRVTLSYLTKVDPAALDAELYSLVEVTPLVRWGGKTLQKISRGAPLTDFYPLKSFEVRFSRPREGEPHDRGQPTVEVVMRDRVFDQDDFKQSYGLIISLVSPDGRLLLNDVIHEVETE